MNSLEKIVWSQDSYFKTEAKNSGETSINLSNELYEFLGGKDGYIVFTLYKEDYLKATGTISNMLPLYTSTSKNSNINHYSNTLVESYYNVVKSKFGDNDTATYKVYMFKRDDGRIYLKELKDSETVFNLRNFLIQSHSKLVFCQSEENKDNYVIRLHTNINEYPKDAAYKSFKEIEGYRTEQKIYFGTPGSGKSWTIKRQYEMRNEGNRYVEDEEKKKRVIRTTFHPDTDYASFVGCYKPVKDEEDRKKIVYEFVPQAFTDAYVAAFQLLDRNKDGYSEYPIKADHDLKDYLLNHLPEDSEGIRDGKLCLPPNLSIIAH